MAVSPAPACSGGARQNESWSKRSAARAGAVETPSTTTHSPALATDWSCEGRHAAVEAGSRRQVFSCTGVINSECGVWCKAALHRYASGTATGGGQEVAPDCVWGTETRPTLGTGSLPVSARWVPRHPWRLSAVWSAQGAGEEGQAKRRWRRISARFRTRTGVAPCGACESHLHCQAAAGAPERRKRGRMWCLWGE